MNSIPLPESGTGASSRITGPAAFVCWLLALLALVLAAGRITTVRSQTGEVPFLSANDRSRWATVASLVDYRTYVIDHFQQLRDPKTNRRTWQSIDRVQHRGTDGVVHNYSSKPPLLPTLIALVYAGVKAITGLGIQQHPLIVGRIVLALVNLPMLAAFFYCLIDLVLKYSRCQTTAVLVSAATTFGTLLVPFAISLNNHLPAATAVAVSLWLLDRQASRGPSWLAMFFAGAAASFAVANELPALSLLPLWGLIALRLGILPTLLGFIPGVAVVAAAFFATNWAAHDSFIPPYAHRGIGAEISKGNLPPELQATAASWDPASLSPDFQQQIADRLEISPDDLVFLASRKADRLRIDGPTKTFALTRDGDQFSLRHWNDWYDYPGTYWTNDKLRGIDRGERSRLVYALHALVGHHGIFSLTPFWVMTVMGVFWARRIRTNNELHPFFPEFRLAILVSTLLVTCVCLAFYISRPEIDRNYGGVSIAFRWLLWQIPLWLIIALPVVERFAHSRTGRVACALLIGASFFSVATALDTPWTHPWLYKLLDNLGWIAGG